jgi:RND family efflux transporter MFP subunit
VNKVKIITAGIAAALVLSSCGGKQAAPAETPRTVRGAPVTEREVSDEISGFGSLSFAKKVDLAAPQEGVVERLFFREGDRVGKGDRVAILGNPQIGIAAARAGDAYTLAEASLALARAKLLEGEFQSEVQIRGLEKGLMELEQARRSLEEMRRKLQGEESLFEAGGISPEGIRESRFSVAAAEEELRLMEKELEIRRIGFRDQDLAAGGYPAPRDEEERLRMLTLLATASLRAELLAAEANLEAARRELESARLMESELLVLSPEAGIVGARYTEEGERVKKEDKLLTLIDTRTLYALFPLREGEALKLKKGMAARVTLDGNGGSYEGTVDLIYPQGDSQSFTFLVRVLLTGGAGSSEPGELKPGMFARVLIPRNPRRITLVPEAALTGREEGRGRVFVLTGNTVSERGAVLGKSYGGEVEVVSGLSPGEVVVLRPDSSLKEGVYVSMAN